MGIIPLGIGIQYSLKRRRITMIRLMGLVELRPVGSLKKEELAMPETNDPIEEADDIAKQTQVAAKKSWSDANAQAKNLKGPAAIAAKERALRLKQTYLDAQKSTLQNKKLTSPMSERDTSLRGITSRIDEAPDVNTDPNMEVSTDDGEGYMAKAQLMSLNKQSGELYNMLSDNEELEAWIQSKITKASDYINAAYNYLQYEKNKANTIGNGEGAPADPSMPTDDNLSEGVKPISKYKSIVTRK